MHFAAFNVLAIHNAPQVIVPVKMLPPVFRLVGLHDINFVQ
jgi:hypothetical protein